MNRFHIHWYKRAWSDLDSKTRQKFYYKQCRCGKTFFEHAMTGRWLKLNEVDDASYELIIRSGVLTKHSKHKWINRK